LIPQKSGTLFQEAKTKGCRKKTPDSLRSRDTVNFPSLRYAERAIAKHEVSFNRKYFNIWIFPGRFRRKPTCGGALHSRKFL